MSQSPLVGAFVGTGEQAGYLVRHAYMNTPSIELAGGYDRNPGAAAAFAQTYGVTAYGSIAEMFHRLGPDIVTVCTPPGAHLDNVAELARLAEAAGRIVGIHCEKPSALTLADHDEMVTVARRAGVVLTFGYDRVFSAVQWLRALIEEGRFGYIVDGSLEWLRVNGVPRRGAFTNREISGGGPGFDILPHLLALALAATGMPPLAVRATTSRAMIERGGSLRDLDPGPVTVEDSMAGTLLLGTETGQAALGMRVAWDLPIPHDRLRIELIGTEGSGALTLEKLPNDDEILVPTASAVMGGEHVELRASRTFRTLAQCRAAQLDDLAMAVQARRAGRHDSPLVTPELARDVLSIVLGAYESAESGEEVRF